MKTTTHKAPCAEYVLKLMLVNKEISRLTNALHKAEMAVIRGWERHYGPDVHGCLRELEVARNVKDSLMERYSSDHRLCLRHRAKGKKAV